MRFSIKLFPDSFFSENRVEKLSSECIIASGGNGLGCQIVYFQTKNPNLGKFWRVLHWKMLVFFMAIWSLSPIFGICLVNFTVIWYIFPVLVCCIKINLATLATGAQP
jgi:hypothetical protein